jgi:TPR repeat protein
MEDDLDLIMLQITGKILVIACVALALAHISMNSDAQSVEPAQSSSSKAPPSDAELARGNCVIGEERVLPGDYYYCIGAVAYGEHNYEQSNRFFTTAASWASKPAQYVLGVMALNGDHQPRNRPLALAWLSLAAERPNSRFKQAYDEAYAASTGEERAASQRLLATMRGTYADATAAVRAEQRYRSGMAVMERLNNSGYQYCIEGLSTVANPITDPSRCPQVQQIVEAVDAAAVNVFDGWAGHVTVEPLQQVNTAGQGKKSN